MNKRKILDSIKFIAVVLVIGLAVGYAFAWNTPPSSTAPDCPASNPACNPPINVGANFQAKAGPLSINTPDGRWGTWPFFVKKNGENQAIITDGNIAVSGTGLFSGGLIIQKAGATDPEPLFYFKTADAVDGKCLKATDENGRIAWGDCAGGSRENYYIRSGVLENERTISISIEKCALASNPEAHSCMTTDCNPNSAGDTGFCVDRPISRVANTVSVYCDPGDVAISASLSDRGGYSLYTSVKPIPNDGTAPEGYLCEDVSRKGAACYVTCLRI